MSIELLPCPFCGQLPAMRITPNGRPHVGFLLEIWCNKFGCSVQPGVSDRRFVDRTQEEAEAAIWPELAAKWNTRYTAPTTTETAEPLGDSLLKTKILSYLMDNITHLETSVEGTGVRGGDWRTAGEMQEDIEWYSLAYENLDQDDVETMEDMKDTISLNVDYHTTQVKTWTEARAFANAALHDRARRKFESILGVIEKEGRT